MRVGAVAVAAEELELAACVGRAPPDTETDTDTSGTGGAGGGPNGGGGGGGRCGYPTVFLAAIASTDCTQALLLGAPLAD